ncbi:hypothetical protein [Undibacterium sp. Xuan67W]|uniref:hypothetical protein n=1 Tax=Undibacterium sp. Xuan67W TaxID=3413057 RepID=UPI003BF46625
MGEDFDEHVLRELILSELQATAPSMVCHTCQSQSALNIFAPAANDSTYAQSDQEPANSDHSGANKSAKKNYFLLFFTILLKRYFWHAITALAASLLSFGVFSDAYSKGQNNHPLTLKQLT